MWAREVLIQRWQWFVPVLHEAVTRDEVEHAEFEYYEHVASELLTRSGQMRIHAKLLEQHWDNPALDRYEWTIDGVFDSFEEEYQHFLSYMNSKWLQYLRTQELRLICNADDHETIIPHVGRYVLAGYYREMLA